MSFIFILAFCGCARMPITHQANRFDIPEVVGDLGSGSIAAGIAGGSRLNAVTDPAVYPPDQMPSLRYAEDDFPLDVHFAMPERTELDLKPGFVLPGVGVKWQLTGQTQERATTGNISLALTATVAGGIAGLGEVDPQSVPYFYRGSERYLDFLLEAPYSQPHISACRSAFNGIHEK